MIGALNPRAINSMEPSLRKTISRLLADVAEKNLREKIDVIEDFASQIPIQIIGDLLGIPFKARASLHQCCAAIIAALEPCGVPKRCGSTRKLLLNS